MPEPLVAEPLTAKLLIGYRLRLNPAFESFMPAYEAPSNYKSEEKIAEYVATRRAEYTQRALSMPYTAALDAVKIQCPRTNNAYYGEWSAERGKSPQHPPLCREAAAWILKRHRGAWSGDVVKRPEPSVVFIGFNPKLFLKILGLECGMPMNGLHPVPLGMWYDNAAGYRDIVNAVVPTDYADHLTLAGVLAARKIVIKEDWKGPGQDPTEDVRIVTEISTQLGMLNH